jgi:hypothetical protein
VRGAPPHLILAAIARPTDPIAKNHKGRTDIWPCRVPTANTIPQTARMTVNRRTKKFRTIKRPSHRMARAGTLMRESSCCHGGVELSRSSPKSGVCTLPSMLLRLRCAWSRAGCEVARESSWVTLSRSVNCSLCSSHLSHSRLRKSHQFSA